MVTNFDYLKKEPKFSAFADVAVSAEKIILLDPEASILNSRRAMEFAVKWMYSVDNALEMPYQDNLQSLMNSEDYRQTIGPDLWKRMDYIRRSGNNAAHSSRKLGRDEAMLCLENLFIYLDYIAYCYSDQYQRRVFDKTLITARIEKAKKSKEDAKAAKCRKCFSAGRIVRAPSGTAADVCSQTAGTVRVSDAKTLYRFHADRSRLGGRQRLDQ